MALMLNNTQDTDERFIKNYEEVEALLSSLVARLHRGKSKDGTDNLEKELRFLLTFLWDIAFMGCHEHQEFQKLLLEFEAVADEVKSLLDSFLFQQTDEAFVSVLSHTDRIRPKITNFLNLVSSLRTSSVGCITPIISAVDSLPIIDSLTLSLEDMIKREDNLVAGEVKCQIEALYEGLILFKSSIKALERLQHSEIRELKQPLLQIGQMAHEAEYLLISFSIGVAPLWYLSNRLTDINNGIRLIGTQLQQITEKYEYNMKSQTSLPANRISVADHVMVGFKDKEVEVRGLLEGGEKRLEVISIIGMPGLGKTTLAKKVYDNLLVNDWFDKLSWCVVSQTYLRKSILIDILTQIQSAPPDVKMEEKELAVRVHQTLKKRRYLIVMDDVWDSNVWNDFRTCFPDDGNGSRILFTSRNKDAAPPDNIVYAMPSLSNDQCWELLEKKVFEDNGCPSQLLSIGKKIAENCSGLPLAVVVIAGVLSIMERKKSTWEQVGENLLSYILNGGDHSVRQILELSYKHLPLHLKPCFLYFARFKEDEEIHAEKLMRLWIAEGFISKEKEKHAEDVAEEYLSELIDKSLIMVAKRRSSDDGVKTCTVHDLLRDFCLERCGEEKFIKFGEKSGDEKGSRLRVVGGPISRRYCQHVRSIHGPISLSSDFDVGDLRLLRLLNFDRYNRVPPVIDIDYLVNLRYLTIRDKYKPGLSWNSFLELICGRLSKLEHLFMMTEEILSIPPAIVRMRKLRFLQLGYRNCGARCNEDWNSSHTTNLEFLSHLVIGDSKDEEALKCSPHLRKLKCGSPDQVKERIQDRHFDLSFLTQLESLNLVFNPSRMKTIIYPANLKKLTLAEAVLTRKKLSTIGTLENLAVLKLRACTFAVNGHDWDTKDGEFQKLRFLKLHDTKQLIGWQVASTEHFPLLQRLVLIDCSLHAIPTEFGETPMLELIEVKGICPRSLTESARQIQERQWEIGNQDFRILARRFAD